MGEIDVGTAAIDRGTYKTQGYTRVLIANAANDDGSLDTVEIWAYMDLSGAKVGTFFGSGTDYTPRDYTLLGAVSSGSKQTFSGLDIEVESGDLVGLYCSGGMVESDSSGGDGVYQKSGDQFSAGQQTYVFDSGDTVSLYATGETASAGASPQVVVSA